MPDSVFTAFGGLSLPISEQDVSSSLSSLDPARDRLLAWFQAAINAEFGRAWTEAVDSLPGNHGLAGSLPVRDTLPFEPTPATIGQRKNGWPLLALHRVGEGTYEDFGIELDLLKQSWHLHHILGPLDIEGERRILDIAQAVGKLLAATIRAHGHPAFEDGANQQELASLDSLRLVRVDGPGPARFDGEEDRGIFWATRYTLETTEVSSDVTDHMPDFDGFLLSLDVGGAGHTDVSPDFIEADSEAVFQYG